MAHNLSDYGDVLTPKDVKEILGIGMNKTYELLAAGEIAFLKIGRVIKIPKRCLMAYIETASQRIHNVSEEGSQ